MKRTGTILSILTLALVGVGLFHVAQNVRDYEGQLKTFNKKIATEQETIHILQAEWFYLNQPARLEKLAKKHTELETISGKNLLAFSVVPFFDEPQEDLVGDKKIAQKKHVNKATGYDSYVSKVAKKSTAQTIQQPTMPIHNISLRDIWGQ